MIVMSQIWISAAALCATTLLGSAIGFFFTGLSHRWNDTILGFCAGVMLAAATVGLILPAFELCTGALWTVVIGVMAGAVFINLIDFLTPHLHTITGLDPELHQNNGALNKVLLFVMAIAIHKMPEGIAAGVSLSNTVGAEESSLAVTLGLSLQNIPEGMVIIAPLLVAGVSKLRTMFISLAIGLLEIVGVWMGFSLGSISIAFLPVMLGFAGGAMLYVISDEMIPETHAHGHQKQATYALLLGFMTLLFVENYL